MCTYKLFRNRESLTFENFYHQHIEHDACVMTDGWSYGSWLNREYRHYVCKKVPVQGHTIEELYEVNDKTFGKIIVHTNTIEGFWSESKSKLHWSRGWPAAYMSDTLYHIYSPEKTPCPSLFHPRNRVID